MARRWFLNADAELVGLSDDDDFAVPTDQTAVLETVIRAADPPGASGRIQAGGKWDGAAYTAPSGDGILVPFDADTDLGRKQIAATTLHNWFHAISAAVHAVRHEKPQIDVTRAEQFIAMGHWANYVAARMSDHHRPVRSMGRGDDHRVIGYHDAAIVFREGAPFDR